MSNLESLKLYKSAQMVASLHAKIDGSDLKVSAIYADLKLYIEETACPNLQNTILKQPSDLSLPQDE